jgi:hypothetical protein
MIETLNKLIRSYTDALFTGLIKTAADGRRIFYPWGLFWSGYVVTSPDDEERLKTSVAVHFVAVVILMAIGQLWMGYAGALVAGALAVAAYVVWLKRATAALQPSSERMSLAESYRAQAIAQGSARLWSWLATGLFLVYLGLAALLSASVNAAAMALLVGLGILFSAFSTYMLVLRRGAPEPSSAVSPAGKSVAAEELATFVTGDVGPIRAWFLAISGVLITALGIFVAVIDPAERSSAAALIVIGALIAAFGIAMLVVRRRRLQGR